MDFDNLLREAESARRSRDWENVCRCLRACMDRFPERQVAEWYAKLGQACFALGRMDEAGAAYAYARERWPDDSSSLVGAAWVADSLKNWEEAARLWQSCIAQFPAKFSK